MLLAMKLETIEHARLRALAQIVIDKDKGVEAFEEYMKIAFPYLEATKRRDREEHIAILNREVQKGVLAVTPMATPEMKSRVGAIKARRQNQTRPLDEKGFYRRLRRI